MKQCPHCAQQVADVAAVCPYCRTAIEPREAAVARAMAAGAPERADHSTFLVTGGIVMTVALVVMFNVDDRGLAKTAFVVAVLGFTTMLVGVVALGVLVGLRTRDRARPRT